MPYHTIFCAVPQAGRRPLLLRFIANNDFLLEIQDSVTHTVTQDVEKWTPGTSVRNSYNTFQRKFKARTF